MAKQSNKVQGKGVTGASLSATNMFPEMRSLSRGLGTSYAMAVNKLLDSAPQISGSRTGFLGVEKKALDANEYGRHSLLPRDYNPRKK